MVCLGVWVNSECLIGSDEVDPHPNYILWGNLASETVFSFNASLPFLVKDVWDIYLNISGSWINNQADRVE